MSSTSRWGAGLVVIGLIAAVPGVARAEAVRYELDSADAMSADGWDYLQQAGTASYAGSLLRVQSSHGFSEFLLRSESGKAPLTMGWVGTVDAGRGWWVEARLSVALASQCAGGGPGLAVNDGKTGVRLLLDATGAHYVSTMLRDIPVASVGELHTYRIQSLGNRHVQVLVDGKLVGDEPTFAGQASEKYLEVGDLGGCGATDSTWDSVAYDTFGPGATPGDEDKDGVANASDNCALVANADQKDGDADGAGDACDICPQDAQNDQDNDGKCADVDVCPGDARNDQDNDGVCDTMQCAPYQGVPTLYGSCPVICNCLPVGNDPIGGYGGLDNFGGTYNPPATGGTHAGSGGGPAKGGVGNGQGGASTHDGGNISEPLAGPASSADAAGCTCSVAERRGTTSTGAVVLLFSCVFACARRRGAAARLARRAPSK